MTTAHALGLRPPDEVVAVRLQAQDVRRGLDVDAELVGAGDGAWRRDANEFPGNRWQVAYVAWDPRAMTTWFTSDPHFGHARLLELSSGRGAAFASVGEMDEALVANWNAAVGEEDVVWVLGDFDMHGKDASLALVSRLNGTKVLVSGNHDACWAGMRDGWKQRSRYLEAGFAAVMDFAVAKLPPVGPDASATRVLLSHFPYAGDSHDKDRYEQFRLRDEGVPLLHGHVHDAFRERRTAKGTWGINVGVDHWDYHPVSAETLAAHLAALG